MTPKQHLTKAGYTISSDGELTCVNKPSGDIVSAKELLELLPELDPDYIFEIADGGKAIVL